MAFLEITLFQAVYLSRCKYLNKLGTTRRLPAKTSSLIVTNFISHFYDQFSQGYEPSEFPSTLRDLPEVWLHRQTILRFNHVRPSVRPSNLCVICNL